MSEDIKDFRTLKSTSCVGDRNGINFEEDVLNVISSQNSAAENSIGRNSNKYNGGSSIVDF